jgi:hypothetical protein
MISERTPTKSSSVSENKQEAYREEIAETKIEEEYRTEPVFVNLLRSTGIDSQPWRAGTTTLYLSYWPARLHKLHGVIDSWVP